MDCEHTQRCSGHCCRRFYLPWSPEQLKEMAETGNHTYNPQEIAFVADMVIPLEAAKEAKFGADGESPPPATGHYYTCRHHDAETGNCKSYETRPRVCRDYPFYGNSETRCRYKDCTWEAARNPPVPVSRSRLIRKLPDETVAAAKCTSGVHSHDAGESCV